MASRSLNRWVEAADRKQREVVFQPLGQLSFSGMETLVLSCVEQERFVVARFEVLHSPDEQAVIAGGMNFDNLHDKVRHRAVEQRDAVARDETDVQILDRSSSEVVT